MKLSYCTLQYKKTEFAAAAMLADVAAATVHTAEKPRRYDGIEWLVTHLETLSSAERLALGAATRKAGLAMPMLGSYIGHYNLAMSNRDEVLATAEKTFVVAHEMQIPLIRCFVGFVCECSSINCPADYWVYNVAGFREVAAALTKFNAVHKTDYRICLETHGQSLVDTVAGCWRFLDDVGSDLFSFNLQLGPDMLRGGVKTFLDAAKALRPRVVNVHTNPDTIGSDAESLKAYQWLAEDGYTGFYSVEGHPPWPGTETGAALAQRRMGEYAAAGL